MDRLLLLLTITDELLPAAGAAAPKVANSTEQITSEVNLDIFWRGGCIFQRIFRSLYGRKAAGIFGFGATLRENQSVRQIQLHLCYQIYTASQLWIGAGSNGGKLTDKNKQN